MKIKALAIAVLCIAFFMIGRWSKEHKWSEAPVINADKPYEVWLPTIRELQQIVGCEKIDGKVGDSWRTSETQHKWIKYTNNYNGVKTCLEAGMQ